MAIGALSGGRMIPYGRRLSMIITSLIGIVGTGFTLIENYSILLLGRVILGFSAGTLGTIVIRMIGEYVPASKKSMCVGIYATAQNLAAFLALCSAMILPKDDETVKLEDDGRWRYILGLPLVLYAWILFGFFVLMRYDSPTFYIAKGMKKEAIASIHMVYKTKGSQYIAE